jgi:hypothetical protein
MIKSNDKNFWKRYRLMKSQSDSSARKFEEIKNNYAPDHPIYRMLYNRMVKDKEYLDNYVAMQMRFEKGNNRK